tara:strand:- start:262 stop:423 length:162 start_codon:yes stop_codon:yes gene_type:complete
MINDLVNVEITILPPHEESNDAPKIYSFSTADIEMDMLSMEEILPPFIWKIVK